jgi:hypothetical protein
VTSIDILGAVCALALIACVIAIVVGETYHRRRKRRWKKRVRRFHEQQGRGRATPTAQATGRTTAGGCDGDQVR